MKQKKKKFRIVGQYNCCGDCKLLYYPRVELLQFVFAFSVHLFHHLPMCSFEVKFVCCDFLLLLLFEVDVIISFSLFVVVVFLLFLFLFSFCFLLFLPFSVHLLHHLPLSSLRVKSLSGHELHLGKTFPTDLKNDLVRSTSATKKLFKSLIFSQSKSVSRSRPTSH